MIRIEKAGSVYRAYMQVNRYEHGRPVNGWRLICKGPEAFVAEVLRRRADA